jgi:ABC-type bacteriocin/lantibiotic exporter with double-glycine peptidase domain
MLKKLYQLLSLPEKRQAWGLMMMILIMAFLDVLGVASIFPFMTVLANPEMVGKSEILSVAFKVANQIGVTTIDKFLFLLGVVVFVLFVFSLIFKAIATYSQIRFSLMREYSIGRRMAEGYLNQSYSWFLSRNSAELSKVILSEVSTVINSGMIPLITLIAQAAVALSLLVLLMVVDIYLAISICGILGLVYGCIYSVMSKSLKRLGIDRSNANDARFAMLSEAFGAIKDVKVAGLENAYLLRYSKPAEIYASSQTSALLIAQLPRFALEAVAFGGLMLVMLYLMARYSDFATVLPIISLYAFAGYRLMPALQQIYGSFAQIRFSSSAIDALHKDLMDLNNINIRRGQGGQMPLHRSISLNNVTYAYPNAANAAIKSVNIEITAGSSIGFVGSTGSGKSTVVDLILGLLEPQIGALQVDGLDITANNRGQWQQSIGYVPQQIYLADDSIAANIALGVDNVDMDAVKRAAKIARLHDFVKNDLEHGYLTSVGERGVRLSGGQRQRIGIARALYKNPAVLVLDEATSALDNITEVEVMRALNSKETKITLIMIAHRLSTVKNCDRIYLMDKGCVSAMGTYEELAESNQQFAKMIGRFM